MYPNSTTGGQCYSRECMRYADSQEPNFYVITIPGKYL